MRSRVGWFLGGLGFAAAVARFFRREPTPPPPLPRPVPEAPSLDRAATFEPELGEPEPPPEDEPTADPRAEELRRRLDESRTLVDEREEFESGETTIDHVEAAFAAPEATPDDRRRQVHERGQSAIDRMKREPPSPGA